MTDLLWPDPDDVYAANYRPRLLAEAHDRLAGIFYPFMLTFIALASLISAEFNRRGYAFRLGVAAVLALGARLVSLVLFSTTVTYTEAALAMYLFPLTICGIAAASISGVRIGRVLRPVRAMIPTRSQTTARGGST